MNILGNVLFKNGLTLGLGTCFALGAGLIMVGPTVVSLMGRAIRPVAKTAIKGGFLIYDQTRSLATGARETARDILAESRSGHSGERETSPSSPAFRDQQEVPFSMRAQKETEAFFRKEPAPEEIEPERAAPWIVRGY